VPVTADRTDDGGTPGELGSPPSGHGHPMAACEVCGNDYRLAFEVHAAGAVHVFDSFECAVHLLAPVCEQCGVKVVGHGVEADGVFFCSAHCGRRSGRRGGDELVDAAGDPPVLDDA
jgi:hypothetical protein